MEYVFRTTTLPATKSTTGTPVVLPRNVDYHDTAKVTNIEPEESTSSLEARTPATDADRKRQEGFISKTRTFFANLWNHKLDIGLGLTYITFGLLVIFLIDLPTGFLPEQVMQGMPFFMLGAGLTHLLVALRGACNDTNREEKTGPVRRTDLLTGKDFVQGRRTKTLLTDKAPPSNKQQEPDSDDQSDIVGSARATLTDTHLYPDTSQIRFNAGSGSRSRSVSDAEEELSNEPTAPASSLSNSTSQGMLPKSDTHFPDNPPSTHLTGAS